MIKLNKLPLFFLLALVFTACNEQPTVQDVLKKADKSVKEMNGAQFNMEFHATSTKHPQPYNGNAKVTFVKNEQDKTNGYQAHIEFNDGTIITFNGKEVRFNDIQRKQLVIADTAKGGMNFLNYSWTNNAISMFVNPNNYFEDLTKNNENIKSEGTVTINGKKANAIMFSSDNKTEPAKSITKLYFDAEGGYPIKSETISVNGTDSTTITFTLSDFVENPKTEESLFTMNAPEGYKTVNFEPPTEPKSLKEGDAAPDFTLKDGDGKDVTLSNLKGNVVVIDFWGTWCGWCVKSIPKINKINENLKNEKVIVMGISCQERESANPPKFLKDKGGSYKTLLVGDKVAQDYGITGFPTLYVIGKDGKILHRSEGYSETMDTDLIALIKKNL